MLILASPNNAIAAGKCTMNIFIKNIIAKNMINAVVFYVKFLCQSYENATAVSSGHVELCQSQTVKKAKY